MIAGLEQPDSGTVQIGGQVVNDIPPWQRNIGMMFQNYALFPHLTVEENVSFPLQMRRIAAADLRRRVADALEMVGLGAMRARFPRELSGGQQQRVALARCFVYQPSLILMDEPLGALDRKLRETMQIEIKRLHRDTGATILFVTHDQEEALALSDRICLMNDGRVAQVGTPQEIYEAPCSSFVAGFIGLSNALRGRVNATGERLETPDGAFAIPPAMRALAAPGQEATLVVRPEHVELGEPAADRVSGTVVETVYAGSETRVFVALASGAVVTVRWPAGQRPVGLGETVSVFWPAQSARLLVD